MMNFDILKGQAVNNLVANLDFSNNRQRWITAIARAVKEFEDNDLMVWNGVELQICSRKSSRIYKTRINNCQCEAFEAGFPCYHRAAVRILLEHDRLTGNL